MVPHATHDGPTGVSVFPLGTQLQYACEEGYEIDGFFRAMCVGEGKWVGPRMTCSRKYTGVIVQNGKRNRMVSVDSLIGRWQIKLQFS